MSYYSFITPKNILKKSLSIFGLILLILSGSACKTEVVAPNQPPVITNPDPSVSDLIKLGEVEFSNTRISLYSTRDLSTGYNSINALITDAAGKIVENAPVKIYPEMKTEMMSHGAPVEQPVYNTVSKLYEAAIIFTMPGETGWKIKVVFNGEEKYVPVVVKSETQKLTASYKGTDGINYQLSIIPKPWKTGMNDLELLIHNGSNGYAVVNDLQVKFDPEMVSMNHGSPNNVDPVFKADGHYNGKVNFTMTGNWRLHFTLINKEVVVEDGFLDISF